MILAMLEIALNHFSALVGIHGPHLKLEATIPSNTFRPEATTISFTVDANDTNVDISLPRWNTHALHASKEGHSLFKAGKLSVEGSYHYFAEAREEHVEQFKMTVNVSSDNFEALLLCLIWIITASRCCL